MSQKFYEMLADHPIIPAIKDNRGLEDVVKTDCKIVFILYPKFGVKIFQV